jgi:3-deoxy-manno-octulosonate cytidylyltransferase (CMP-KDO synthetase)
MGTPDNVFVATDDDKIADHVRALGGQLIMTSGKPRNGTERVLEAANRIGLAENDLVVNLQGDAVLTPPWTIKALVDACQKNGDIKIGTLRILLSEEADRKLLEEKQKSPTSGTYVACRIDSDALFFSKRPDFFAPPRSRHIGMYAYRVSVLKQFCSLPQCSLEELERLEQMRAIYNRIPIRVVEADYRGRTHASVDSPSDIKFVEAIIAQEGELI